MTKTEANEMFAQINMNIEDWYAERIDFSTFTERQRATWVSIREAGVEAEVLKSIRDATAA